MVALESAVRLSEKFDFLQRRLLKLNKKRALFEEVTIIQTHNMMEKESGLGLTHFNIDKTLEFSLLVIQLFLFKL